MKTLQLIPSMALLGAVFFFSGCKKDNTEPDEPQGTNYNLLLKTVTTSNYSAQVTTTQFSYNSNGKITSITASSPNAAAGSFSGTETFTRNTSGLPVAIDYVTTDATGITRTTTQNTYDPSGKFVKTIQRTTFPGGGIHLDSMLYQYSGTVLNQRTDFRSINGSPYSLLVTLQYQYNSGGNLDRAILAWSTHPGIDTLRLVYDDKVNPLPFARSIGFYWAEIFADDYTPLNNVKQVINPGLSSFVNEYRYSANNKPLYRKTLYPGTTNYDETYYYYD